MGLFWGLKPWCWTSPGRTSGRGTWNSGQDGPLPLPDSTPIKSDYNVLFLRKEKWVSPSFLLVADRREGKATYGGGVPDRWAARGRRWRTRRRAPPAAPPPACPCWCGSPAQWPRRPASTWTTWCRTGQPGDALDLNLIPAKSDYGQRYDLPTALTL